MIEAIVCCGVCKGTGYLRISSCPQCGGSGFFDMVPLVFRAIQERESELKTRQWLLSITDVKRPKKRKVKGE